MRGIGIVRQDGMSFQTGDTIADYRILGILGRGGMGAVYRVSNLLTGREEAMKVVLPDYAADADAADRFLREIKIQASLQHPNITALRTAVRAENHILMIMELVEGASLEAMLTNGPLGLAQAIRITDDILGALSYAHQHGVIHRDVKPSNIVVTSRGLPKLMDFGIARAAGDIRLTQSGMAVGSLYYMSPEQVLSRPVDVRSDIYSMGATFYEMLTGRRPVEGEGQYAVMNAHLSLVPVSPSEIAPGVPREVSSVVLKSLEKAPEQRYQTAAEFQAAVRQTIFGSGATMRFEESELARLETRLASSVGPIAKTLVAKSAAQHSNLSDLYRDLAQQIPGEAERLAFMRAVGIASLSPSASQAAPLDERTLDAARKALAAYLGPMASMVVNKAARTVTSKEQLKAALAAEIHDEQARRVFLASF
jgi:serine/threonine protein kinase